MEVNEEHVEKLLNMGFPSEAEVRRALKIGKNDLNEAVAILTNEHPSSNYDTLDDLDVEMKDVEGRATTTGPVYGPSLPPSYEDVVDSAHPPPSTMSSSTSPVSRHALFPVPLVNRSSTCLMSSKVLQNIYHLVTVYCVDLTVSCIDCYVYLTC